MSDKPNETFKRTLGLMEAITSAGERSGLSAVEFLGVLALMVVASGNAIIETGVDRACEKTKEDKQ